MALGTKRYVVGNQLVTLSGKVIGSAFRTARRHAVLRTVAEEIGEQCEIGTVRDDTVCYVDSVSSQQPLGLQFRPGETAPLHCTSTGKIHMSRMRKEAREKLIQVLDLKRYTETTIANRGKLLKVLGETRRRGWAKTNEEYVKGVVGCAVPILSPDRELIACLGVSVPVARVSFAELDSFIAPLQRAAALLSETILQLDSDFEEEATEPGR